jgi:NAD(P)-dependent dehydrogenase (short-subunit alcohol dehydrogenase family)
LVLGGTLEQPPSGDNPAAGSMGVALVTGGSRGAGRAVALGLGAAGFAVAILARSPGELEETYALLRRNDLPSLACVADVIDPVGVARSVAVVEDTLGPISTLVNNAGTSLAIGPLWEVDPHDWWTDIETSLGGTFNLCRCVIPGMIARGFGRILNVSSYAGVRPAPYQSGYGCAKAGVTILTESLAASLSGHGVRVFAITPGFVHTELTKRMIESPAGRRWLPEAGTRDGLDLDLFVRLAVRLALGDADVLSGRLLHALDDIDELLRRIDDIERDELYVPRLRRLPAR